MSFAVVATHGREDPGGRAQVVCAGDGATTVLIKVDLLPVVDVPGRRTDQIRRLRSKWRSTKDARTYTTTAPRNPPSIWAAMYEGTLRHENPRNVARAIVTWRAAHQIGAYGGLEGLDKPRG